MITSLFSHLFPSPNDTIQLPFSSRLCILVPIVCRTQYNNRNVCDTDLPVSRTSSKSENLLLQLWGTQYIVNSEETL